LAASGYGSVAAVYADENVWLSRKIMGQLYDVESHTINNHLRNIYTDSRLPEDTVAQNISNNLWLSVPQMGHRHYQVHHHQGLSGGWRASKKRRLIPRKKLSLKTPAVSQVVTNGE